MLKSVVELKWNDPLNCKCAYLMRIFLDPGLNATELDISVMYTFVSNKSVCTLQLLY